MADAPRRRQFSNASSVYTIKPLIAASAALSAVAWILLAIQGEFHVSWLRGWDGPLGTAFVAGLAGVAFGWSVEHWGAPRVTAVTIRVAVSAFATAVTLVVAEFGLRYVFRDVYSSADGRTFFAHRRGGPTAVLNSLGFREREIPPKSAARYRIAIVGDSFTFGQGIEERERFSNLLGASLGSQYEVLNFGNPGNNLPQHLDVLGRALRAAPDFVLLQLYINDFEVLSMMRPLAHPLLPAHARLLAAAIVGVHDLLNDSWGQQYRKRAGWLESYSHYAGRNLGDPDSPNSREAFGLLRRFVEQARGGRSERNGAVSKSRISQQELPLSRTTRSRSGRLCRTSHQVCVDLRAVFAASFRNPQAMWVSRFDPHPNARANFRAAQEILAAFREAWHR